MVEYSCASIPSHTKDLKIIGNLSTQHGTQLESETDGTRGVGGCLVERDILSKSRSPNGGFKCGPSNATELITGSMRIDEAILGKKLISISIPYEEGYRC